MRFFGGLCCVLAGLGTAMAQAPAGPVIDPRGVVNSFTLAPAPSSVAPGGLFTINGTNLASDSLQASGVPWPMTLLSTSVTIAGRPAPLYSVSPGTIVAQAPWECVAGLAAVVVQNGGVSSSPAWITIAAVAPSVLSSGDNGYGPVQGTVTGNSLVISASSLGSTTPAVATGAAATATPASPITAYVGGLPAAATATLDPTQVGQFDIAITVPAGAQAGDVIQLYEGRTAANPVTYGSLAAKDAVQFIAIPDGTPVLTSAVAADLKGNYLIGSAARDSSGCYASFLIDVANQNFSSVGCLTTASATAASPVVAATESSVLAAMVGPPTGDATTGVSSQVVIFNPANTSAMTVTLPSPAVSLAANANGNFNAALAGTPKQTATIDAQTGAVTVANTPTATGTTLSLDLGNGLTDILTPTTALGTGTSAVIVGNDPNRPTAAKLAVVNGKGAVSATQDFPAGWLPFVSPAVQSGGGVTAAAATQANAARVRTYFDTTNHVYYVLTATSDGTQNGFVAFAFDKSSPIALPFPSGWFATACTTPIPLYSFNLSHQIAVAAAQTQPTTTAAMCPASGFVGLDLDAHTVAAMAMPGGQFNAASGGAVATMNNYVYATDGDPNDTDRTLRKAASTLFVLDGVSANAFELALPAGAQSFATLTQIDALNSLAAEATNTTAGDAGIVLFDMHGQTANLVPPPSGYAMVTLLGAFPATRKLVAVGTKASGSNLLVFDLNTSSLVVVPNPAGVGFVGTRPAIKATAAAPAQTFPTILTPNSTANTVAAIGYDASGKQTGVILLRVP